MTGIIIEMDPLTTEEFTDDPIRINFNQEVVALGDSVYVTGYLSLVSGNSFYTEYYVAGVRLAKTSPAPSLALAATFNASDLPYGESEFVIYVKTVLGEPIATIRKQLWHSYYNFFVEQNGIIQPKRDLALHMTRLTKVYVGLSQPLKYSVAEDILVPLNINFQSTIYVRPIFDSDWTARSGNLPSKEEVIKTNTVLLNEGQDTISLRELCITANPFYGIVLETQDTCDLDLNFQPATFSYYKTYIDRPKTVDFDKITIDWSDISINKASNFQKFEVVRDGSVVFTTTDFNVRTFDDYAKDYEHPNGIELDTTYHYQLKSYLVIPVNPDWILDLSHESFWEKTAVDSKLNFTENEMKFKILPSYINLKLSEVTIVTPNISYSSEKGIYVNQTGGVYIHAEHTLGEVLCVDFSDRVGISSINVSTVEDDALVLYEIPSTFYKNLTDGKFYTYSVKKRLRSLKIR